MITDVAITEKRVEIVPFSFVLTKAKIIFAPLAIILFTLVVLQLAFANHLATQGQRVSEFEAKIKNTEEVNKDLKMQINQKSSLKEVLEKSKELGFKKPQSFFFVKENFAVAEKGKIQ